MKKTIVILFILSAFTVPLFLGEHALSFKTILTGLPSMDSYILWNLRLPRMLFAFVVGAGLAIVGAVFQALLRNDLATPYTLGVSSGGALGAVLAIKLGLDLTLLGFSTISVFSMVGSLLTLGLIWLISVRHRGFADFTLILSGVTISLTISALILFIHYLADFTETYRMIRWLMGSLEVSGWQSPLFLLGLLTAAFVYFYYHSEAFNILLAGDDLARSKGVDVQRLQLGSFFLASLLVGGIVSLAGPIGFVGLIVPHVLRLQLGPDHHTLFPASVFLGGAFLIWSDTFARLVIYPAELPVGIVTSLFGGPFFIYLLVKNR